jgi:hypothetical protein
MALSNDVLEGLDSKTRSAAAPTSLVSVGVLSFGALQTISRTLKAHRESGLIDCAGEFFVHFNAITPDDKAIAGDAGVPYTGTAENLGIYGGFRAIAERAKNPYVLILENDVVPLPGAAVRDCLGSCVSDMMEHDIKSFCLRSRREPGEGSPYAKYIKTFGLLEPISPSLAPKKAASFSQLRMFLEHGGIDKFRAASLFCERDPEAVQKQAVRKLPSSNYLTDSRYRNWSNQAVLVERQYFLDVVCRRVDEHPDPRLVNGHQDIERALNRSWWRRRRDRMGHAAEGVFTHRRLDR